MQQTNFSKNSSTGKTPILQTMNYWISTEITKGKILILFLLLFYNNKHIFVFFLHQVLLTGKFLKIVIICLQLFHPLWIFLYSFQVIGLIGFKSIYSMFILPLFDQVVFIKDQNPYKKHQCCQHIFIFKNSQQSFQKFMLIHNKNIFHKNTNKL